MQTIDLQQIPNQTLNIVLNEQNCEITIKEKNKSTFLSLKIDDTVIFDGIVAHNLLSVLPFDYMAFNGSLMFVDTLGSEDPDYTLYNDRFLLIFLTDEEYDNI